MISEQGEGRHVLNRLPEGVLGACLQLPEHGLGPAVVRRALIAARNVLRTKDPLVQYRIGSFNLWLPSSHNLPYFQKAFPDYSMNIGRIGSKVAQKYPDL